MCVHHCCNHSRHFVDISIALYVVLSVIMHYYAAFSAKNKANNVPTHDKSRPFPTWLTYTSLFMGC